MIETKTEPGDVMALNNHDGIDAGGNHVPTMDRQPLQSHVVNDNNDDDDVLISSDDEYDMENGNQGATSVAAIQPKTEIMNEGEWEWIFPSSFLFSLFPPSPQVFRFLFIDFVFFFLLFVFIIE